MEYLNDCGCCNSIEPTGNRLWSKGDIGHTFEPPSMDTMFRRNAAAIPVSHLSRRPGFLPWLLRPWVVAVLASLPLRLALTTLPGVGRDEAVYVYWSHHPFLFYAPLLQALLVLSRPFQVLSRTAAIRLPVLFSGALLLFLVDQVLRHRGASTEQRRRFLFALALTPWFVYAGGILHPDLLFAACLVLAVLLADQHQLWLAALAVGLAMLAKPVGLAVYPAWCLWVLVHNEAGWRRRTLWMVLPLLMALPVVTSLSRPALAAVFDFGRVGEQAGLPFRIGLGVAAVFCLGGWLMPVRGLAAVRQVLESRPARPRAARLSVYFGLVLLSFFLAALLFHGQVKGNWFLPAFLLLWLHDRGPISTRLWWKGIAFQMVLVLIMVTGLRVPAAVTWLENRLSGLRQVYVLQAGERDRRVASVATWSERVREYHVPSSLGPLVRSWLDARQGQPKWLVSDDYGLAAQTWYYLKRPAIRIMVPPDPLLSGPSLRHGHFDGGALVLLVRLEVPPALHDVPCQILSNPINGSAVHMHFYSSVRVALQAFDESNVVPAGS